jgi:hypothetical protein
VDVFPSPGTGSLRLHTITNADPVIASARAHVKRATEVSGGTESETHFFNKKKTKMAAENKQQINTEEAQ